MRTLLVIAFVVLLAGCVSSTQRELQRISAASDPMSLPLEQGYNDYVHRAILADGTEAGIQYRDGSSEQCDRKGGNCMESLEATILAKPESKARHSGDVLTIHTKSKIVSFKDRPNAGGQTILNTYLGYLDGLNYHLVDRRRWEGDSFTVVSDISGEQFPMAAIPHASPSAKRIVSVSASEAYNPNEITVWCYTGAPYAGVPLFA